MSASDLTRQIAKRVLTAARRHLVRLWLRDPEYAWDTPSALKPRWEQLYDGVAPDRQVFPLEPTVRSASNGSLKANQ